ncbi:hypothetical protein [Paraburkholderia sp. SIMBA_030]|uniref:phosphorylase family protein n=1 Tax=Paraburkholderia sp. SIMBA_030 TaxID=3085773 RepID=UPI00397E7729
MRLLIVDDEYEKAIEISKVIATTGAQISIEHVTTSTAARRALRTGRFEFAVIDLNLPDAVGAPPTKDGGIALFDLLMMDERSSLPTDVLFLSAKDDLISEAATLVIERGATLCRFGLDTDEWKHVLSGKLKLAAERARRAQLDRPPVDVAVVTALISPELTAVLDLDYGWSEKRFPEDLTNYHFGSFDKEGQPVRVMAASAGRKGMPSSAALASKIVERFRPKYIVMLGICAGVRGKTGLGDVIVADPSWDCGSGKMSESEDGSPVFLAAPYQKALNPVISQLALDLASKSATSKAITGAWNAPTPAGNLSIRVGPMASGAAVLAHGNAVLPITAQNRELLGVEMEAYAVMAAADYAVGPQPTPIAIKSVCDFADAQKSDDWQAYAAFTSARFFDRLVRDIAFPIQTSSGL